MNHDKNCIICTAFRQNHEEGAAALVNSLVKSGFQGKLLLGVYNSGPSWLNQQTLLSCAEAGLDIQLYPLNANEHPSHVKPKLLQAAFDKHTDAQYGFFFDADIVVRAPFAFFLDWVSHGIALVGHDGKLPPTHPHRLLWLNDGKRLGLECKRTTDEYINGGFIGIGRNERNFLEAWETIIEFIESNGLVTDATQGPGAMAINNRWSMTDQSALNLTVMATENPISVISGDGMDFQRQGFVMSHAAGRRKPWEPGCIKRALNGMPPNKADHNWLSFLEGPARPYTPGKLKKVKLAYRIASCLGRFYRNENWSYYPPG